MCEEDETRERGQNEYVKRERDEKQSGLYVFFGTREIEKKKVCTLSTFIWLDKK